MIRQPKKDGCISHAADNLPGAEDRNGCRPLLAVLAIAGDPSIVLPTLSGRLN